MIPSIDDTIAALAAAPGGAARGVLRISGPAAVDCALRVFFSDEGPPAEARKPQRFRGRLRLDPPLGEVPGELYLWPTARSYTRQPVAELHTFGSPPLLEAALAAVCAAGARLATPGEFTLRAFLAGRIDLTQAEAVLGVIDAQSRRQLDTALDQLAGGLAAPLRQVRETVLEILVHVEAGLDFADEDIAFIDAKQLDCRLAEAAEQLAAVATRMQRRGQARGQARIVLLGQPNVGKSSLMNALVAEDAALVSSRPGTTRDYVTRRTTIAGIACELVDTAGIDAAAAHFPAAATTAPHEAAEITGAAQQASLAVRRQADLEVLCVEAMRPLSAWERAQLHAADADCVAVLTKCDLLALPTTTHRTVEPPATVAAVELAGRAIATSSHTGQGLNELRRAIAFRIAEQAAAAEGAIAGTAARCGESLRWATEALRQARTLAAEGRGEELVAAELRAALDHLGLVVGAVYTDDLLDRIFSRFCIGK